MEKQYKGAVAKLSRRIQSMSDPSNVDMHRIEVQSAREKRETLLRWSRNMKSHEEHTIRLDERVYLVVSDLRLLAVAEYFSGQDKWHSAHWDQPHDSFLYERDIDSLHENHWAVEVDGRYYELARRNGGRSKFSSSHLVETSDRQIIARVFIGTTHIPESALKEIGETVIRMQLNYELTRDNCHRFVRVFSKLILCPNHEEHSIPELPIDVEELITKTDPSLRTHGHQVLTKVGQGVEWTLIQNYTCFEFRRTLRTLKQKTTTHTEPVPGTSSKYEWMLKELAPTAGIPITEIGGMALVYVPQPTVTMKVYHNEFKVDQEQTSYFLEMDPKAADQLSRCRPVDENPYLTMMRFEKVSKYEIAYSESEDRYAPKDLATGMVSAPYGITWTDNRYITLHPVEFIHDKYGVWRTGSGRRLQQPKCIEKRIVAELRDFFGRTSHSSFGYSLPAWDLLVLMSKQDAVKETFKWTLIGAAALPVMSWAIKPLFSKESTAQTRKKHSRESSKGLVQY